MADGADVQLFKTITTFDYPQSSHLIVKAEGTVDGNYRNNFTDINAGGINLQGDGENFFQTIVDSYNGFKHTGESGGIITVNGNLGITFPEGIKSCNNKYTFSIFSEILKLFYELPILISLFYFITSFFLNIFFSFASKAFALYAKSF
jgi:hypothetical protein